jgi:hypothetical protein
VLPTILVDSPHVTLALGLKYGRLGGGTHCSLLRAARYLAGQRRVVRSVTSFCRSFCTTLTDESLRIILEMDPVNGIDRGLFFARQAP